MGWNKIIKANGHVDLTLKMWAKVFTETRRKLTCLSSVSANKAFVDVKNPDFSTTLTFHKKRLHDEWKCFLNCCCNSIRSFLPPFSTKHSQLYINNTMCLLKPTKVEQYPDIPFDDGDWIALHTIFHHICENISDISSSSLCFGWNHFSV